MDITAIMEVMPITIPRIVSKERFLCTEIPAKAVLKESEMRIIFLFYKPFPGNNPPLFHFFIFIDFPVNNVENPAAGLCHV